MKTLSFYIALQLFTTGAIAQEQCFVYADTKSPDSGVCCESKAGTMCIKNTGEIVVNKPLTISQIIECDTDLDCCIKNPTIDREFCERKTL